MRTSRLILVTVCLAFSTLTLFIARPMTSYRLLALDADPSAVGWVSALYAVAPLALALPAGRWATGRWATWMGVAGTAVMAISCGSLAVANSIGLIAAATIGLGLGQMAQTIGYQSLITRETPSGRFDQNFVWYTTGGSLGQMLGPIVGTVVFEASGGGLGGTAVAMTVASAASVVGALLALVLAFGEPDRRDRAGRGRRPSVVGDQSSRVVLACPGAKSAIYMSLVLLTAVDLLSVYLPVLGEEQGIAATTVGLLLAVRAGASLISRLVLAFWVARASRRKILLWTVTSSAILVCLLPLGLDPLVMALVMAGLGVGLGVGQPLTIAWVVSIVPPTARSTALAVRLLGNRLGQLLIPGVASVTVTASGVAAVFFLTGVLTATTLGGVAKDSRT